ncbi:DNA repair exonuclease SbcCD nuclease subunit [Nitrosospira sp. Nsp14]|uniref:metallophosphoesterase family protein n=1 Tax=Nitrosospira sp. Nsp14 TaxID=1855333 RepID=UPI0008F1DBC9|nr:DNA repair exonuclease [Nitrosospira sp. Nsp14]SFH58238.1 DNA repair exonuclease SbcCD nuclease subunit [Nitrosospira sp. Nsp14]
MKFIHAADIHLDSPLTGLSAYSDAPVEMLRNATRDAFTNLVTEAIEQQADFMVIAGDLYDGTWKDHNTGIYFCREMGRLKKAGIPVYLLFGNHDAESDMTKKLQWPENVFAFDARRPETFFIDHLNVALHGHSFKDRETTENLVTGYPAPVQGMFNIGVLHTALEGNAAHATYAPCSLEELHAKGYHYWALGHVHEHQVWHGASTVVFPGNLQGRHIRETGARGAVLVTVDEGEVSKVERLLVDVLRWHSLHIDATDCDLLADVVNAARKGLEELIAHHPAAIPAAVRVTVTGRTPAHGDLFGLEAQLRLEILAIAATIGMDRLWIEKVKIATSVANDSEAARTRGDALSDLQNILEAADTDPAFLESLRADLLMLVTKSPPELQAAVPYFKGIRSGDLIQLVCEVRPGLLSYLARKE